MSKHLRKAEGFRMIQPTARPALTAEGDSQIIVGLGMVEIRPNGLGPVAQRLVHLALLGMVGSEDPGSARDVAPRSAPR
jgi:hypothetical protein